MNEYQVILLRSYDGVVYREYYIVQAESPAQAYDLVRKGDITPSHREVCPTGRVVLIKPLSWQDPWHLGVCQECGRLVGAFESVALHGETLAESLAEPNPSSGCPFCGGLVVFHGTQESRTNPEGA